MVEKMEPLGAQLPLASLLCSITMTHAWGAPQAVPVYQLIGLLPDHTFVSLFSVTLL